MAPIRRRRPRPAGPASISSLPRERPAHVDFFGFASGRAGQKARFGGEHFPNVVEPDSGLVFADFFKNERDGGRKGVVVLTLGGS